MIVFPAGHCVPEHLGHSQQVCCYSSLVFIIFIRFPWVMALCDSVMMCTVCWRHRWMCPWVMVLELVHSNNGIQVDDMI